MRVSLHHREFLLEFVKLHILYHAHHEPLFGLELIRELARHGYTLSPGTPYPVLYKLEEQRLLKSSRTNVAGKMHKYYRITAAGCKVLAEGVEKARESVEETGGEG